jgi:periplasmic protein TonB
MLQQKSVHATDLSGTAEPQPFSSQSTVFLEPTGTFSRAIMVESHGYIERCATHSVISLAAHIVMTALLLTLPMFFSTVPRLTPWIQEMVTVPLRPSKEPPRPRRYIAATTKQLFSSMQPLAPAFNSHRTSQSRAYPLPAMDTLQSLAMGPTDGSGAVLGGILGDTAPRLVAPILPDSFRTVRVGGEVERSRPLYKLTLRYPELAKAARITGRVVIQAVIDETGKVIDVRLVSGPVLLSTAVIAAVSKERFEPMLLNGEPTRCDLLVQVSFRLDPTSDY